MKKVIAIILNVMIIVSMLSVAFAEPDASTYASRVISQTTVAIRCTGGKVYGGGNIKTVATADKVGISSIALYEKNGTSWTKLTSASGKYGYGTDDYSYTISAPATEGKTYKVTVTFYGKIGSLTATHTQSQTSTY